MSERIDKGPNSIAGKRIVKDPIKEAVAKTIGADYKVSLTQTETLSVLAEKTGSKESVIQVKQFLGAITDIQELHDRVKKDQTRNNSEKLSLFSSKSKQGFTNLDKSVNAIAQTAMSDLTDAQSKLFSHNIGLDAIDNALLPQMATMLSSTESELSINMMTESEGRTFLNIATRYPSLVNAKQFTREALLEARNDLNLKFSEEAYNTVRINHEIHKTITGLVSELSKAKQEVLPSDLLANLSSTRVA